MMDPSEKRLVQELTELQAIIGSEPFGKLREYAFRLFVRHVRDAVLGTDDSARLRSLNLSRGIVDVMDLLLVNANAIESMLTAKRWQDSTPSASQAARRAQRGNGVRPYVSPFNDESTSMYPDLNIPRGEFR